MDTQFKKKLFQFFNLIYPNTITKNIILDKKVQLMTFKTKAICQQLCYYVDKNLIPFMKQTKSADYMIRQWCSIKKMIEETNESLFVDKIQKHLKQLNNISPSSSGQYFYQQKQYSLNNQKKFNHIKTENFADKDNQKHKISNVDKNVNVNINTNTCEDNSEINKADSNIKFEALSKQRSVNFENTTVSKYESVSPSKNNGIDCENPYKALQLGSMKKIGESPKKNSVNSYSDQQGFNNIINCFQKLIRNFENSSFHQFCEISKLNEYNYTGEIKSKKSKTVMKSKFQREFNNLIE